MRILIEKDGKTMVESADLDDVRAALKDQETLLWVDLDGAAPDESRQILTQVFDFHPLSVDDALVEIHVPKIDDWGSYLYTALVAIRPDRPLDDIDKSIELDVFVGANYIVTCHQEPVAAIDLVWNNLLHNEAQLQRGSKFILYQLIDALVDEYMQMIDYLDAQVDEIEDTVIIKPDKKMLEDIFSIKRSLLNLRRIVSPQREVLNKLSRGDFEIVSQKERMYFRDLYDHLVRVHEIIESLRDMVSGALDTYLSVVNNQLSNIMKTLTIITTLFMPLSFLTGFFGMNFFSASGQLNHLTSSVSFFLAMAVMVFLPILMFLWMRRRDWM
ncbi:MAG: magnesium/cobalt transporter CorA [Brevefilum fermentans]